MVLYFSGTGNSLYIAKRIANGLGERLVSIGSLVCNNQYHLTLEEGESIGFVYPVIACAPPDVVTDFVKKVTFEGYQNKYVYSVYNCAGSPEYTSRIMKRTCEKRGLAIQGFYDVLMPGNYITRKKHLPKEKVEQYLSQCDGKVDEIMKQIQGKVSNYKKEKHSFLLSYGLHKLAVLEKTEPFHVKEACVGCVNVCPTRALQVGKKTEGNPQYINPYYDGRARWNEK